MIYIGFWRRVVAAIIDSLIAGVVFNLLFWIILHNIFDFTTIYGLAVLSGLFYYVLFESSKYQATPGKMAIGAKVVDYSGMRISLGRAFLRYVSKILSTLVIFIGFIMVAFTARKQGLHDFIAKTLVVKA